MTTWNLFQRFLCDARGAVTLDWVALTSTVVVIGIGLVYMVFSGPDGAITSMIGAYNAELSQAADNLAGVVAGATPPALE